MKINQQKYKLRSETMMNTHLHLVFLDDHIIYNFISYLNLYDTQRFLLTSKRFSNLLKQDFLYKNLCVSNYFENDIIVERKPEQMTYKEYFIENVQKIVLYKRIFNKVIRLYMKQPALDFFKDVQTDKPYRKDEGKLKKILTIVKEHYKKISKDVIMMFRILNGQEELKETDDDIFNKVGFFGCLQYYHTYQIYVFNAFSHPQCGFLENFKAHPFSQIYPLKKSLFIDVTNQLNQGYQSIYSFYPYSQNNGILYIYIAHQSLDSFMNKFDRYNWNESDEFLDMFDTQNLPGSDTTTKGIRIRATAKQPFINKLILFFVKNLQFQQRHIPQDVNNSLDEFFYSYSVRVSANNMESNKKYKLTKRKWIITSDAQPDKPETIEGPGVIGFYPEIYPDCEDFIYQSCSSMKGFTGSMRGAFEFKDQDNGETFDAIIDSFPFRPDYDAKLISINLDTRQTVVLFEQSTVL